jgi:hypothetical protein
MASTGTLKESNRTLQILDNAVKGKYGVLAAIW